MIDPELVKNLRCPETHAALRTAEPALIERLNEAVAAGRLVNRGGQTVARRCDAGLVREDGQYLYPICEDIPVLLINEAIPLPPPG